MAIIGEPISGYVAKEIDFRQKTQYEGFGSQRSESHIQYLHNKSSWVKMASSVHIGGILPSIIEKEINGKPNPEYQEALDEVTLTNDLSSQRLKSIGLNPTNFTGNRLAEQFVLFNGASEVGNPNQRAGIASNINTDSNKLELWNSNSAYGLGGSDYGLQPIPGINSIAVECLNRGSIRKATIELKAYNKFQFELIELLYLRVGFHILLEFGNDRYHDHKSQKYLNIGNTILETSWFKKQNTSQLEMLDEIKEYRSKYNGNYEGFFGRVTNFTWDVTPEGSYNITIELHTVGDVVESIQVNFPVSISEPLVSLPSGSDKIAVEEAIETTLDAFLYHAEQNKCNDEGNTDYINVNAIFSAEEQKLEETDTKKFSDLKQSKEKYTKYVRFGELFQMLTLNFLPTIVTENRSQPLVQLNQNEESQIMGYHLNQTPLDPRVCTFKVPKTEFLKRLDYPLHMDYINDFVFSPKEGVTAGKILNLYLNFDFIKKSMKNNMSQDGKLSIFKFLQNICNGLNSALGNVNKLEPIIIDDNKISIIDQNPIPGLIESQKQQIEFQTFGYNQPKKSSSIIKDISLTTSITPDMATMVTIGATSTGGKVKGIDSTYFSKWNAGLNDRFNLKTFTPELSEEQKSTIQKKQLSEKFGKEWEKIQLLEFKSKVTLTSDEQDLKSEMRKAGVQINNIDDFFLGGSNKIRIAKDQDPLLSAGLYTKQEYIDTKYTFHTLKSEYKEKQTEQILKQNYYYYLVKTFGCKTSILIDNATEVPPNTKPRFLEFDPVLIGKGKSSYSEFLRVVNQRQAKAAENEAKKIEDLYSSDQIGFIPFNLGLTLEGISGIKIYNKISIDQKFLPKNYPSSLHFISTKVNHYVRDNNWETQLETMVLPKTKVQNYKIEDIKFLDNGEDNLLPLDERGPKIAKENDEEFYFKYSNVFNTSQLLFTPDRYFGGYGRKNDKALDFKDLLKDFHPEAKERFENFFTELKEKYTGYHALVNSIYRTPERSKEIVNELGETQSVAENSYHNWGAAIDFNIVTSKGETLKMKGNYAQWKNHGIPDLASKYGIAWGGEFSDKELKEDAVHFYIPFEFSKINKNVELVNKIMGKDNPEFKIHPEHVHKLSLKGIMSEEDVNRVFKTGKSSSKLNADVTFTAITGNKL